MDNILFTKNHCIFIKRPSKKSHKRREPPAIYSWADVQWTFKIPIKNSASSRETNSARIPNFGSHDIGYVK